ncbi:tryptophan repressor-binding protein [Moorella sp. E308F]|uniref:NAD(P)H:quinone oxidoreductase n=1 Tax=unclassified Neomoorella TaxID=2676739 RepID=UPI0010FFC093|nr:MULTISPECIES: NAD(P)H:quinone oxidoreductase [unclassified Moorella (in: firmicutes)]GEA14009.1 tryptophan repressor-binding protein [Moorella sp. E308F]GEA18618.1 tryptophan repressor-binding protein [Moorella sp. E306M]
MAGETKILVVFYSLYGNTAKLARAVGAGVTEIPGCTAILKRVPETMPRETLQQLEKSAAYQKAQEEMKDISIATLEDLQDVDGVIFGSPSHFGNAAAQLKQFIDATVPLWGKGQLAGKVGGVFCTSGSIHGGNEATLISMLLPLLHHGMIIVGRTYEDFSLVNAGTPYGASATSGPNHDQPPTDQDQVIARSLGKRIATVAQKLKG